MFQPDQKKVYNLVLGFAGPYGAGSSSLAEELERSINDWPGCVAVKIHVASLIERIYPFVFKKELKSHGDDKAGLRKERQKAGTELRKKDPEFVGKIISAEIYEKGLDLEEKGGLNNTGTVVFLVDSIKNQKEVECLRRIYLNGFYLIFVHSDRETRWRRMVDYKGWKKEDRVKFEERDLVDQDERSVNGKIKGEGQQVGRLAGVADYYLVNNENREKLKEDGERFLEILLGDGTNQPSIHERCMHLAYSASNRSYCLSRQVGAAIVDERGNIVGLGHNDPPKGLGGLYGQDGSEDKRCYLVGDRRCINDTNKEERFDQITSEVSKEFALTESQVKVLKRIIERSDFKDATEYCRAVHAEMEAILSVCRTSRGSTLGCTMYVTTQPCHSCTKHIICAGIKEVIFIEPYPKSLALELHSDAIEFGPKRDDDAGERKVLFNPYQGVAPHRFHDFFALIGDRKDSQGRYLQKSKETQAGEPRFGRLLSPRSRKVEPYDPVTLSEMECLKFKSNFYREGVNRIKIKKGEKNE